MKKVNPSFKLFIVNRNLTYTCNIISLYIQIQYITILQTFEQLYKFIKKY